MSIPEIISFWINRTRVNPDDIALIISLWDSFVWFMTYYPPPIFAVGIAYHYGKKAFVKEKDHDRKALKLARSYEYKKQKYSNEGFDKLLLSLDKCLANFNLNYSIAQEVEARCKTVRPSDDNLGDLSFIQIETYIEPSPFLRVNYIVADNIYHILMQLVQANTETYYFSRCLDIMDLGKHILKTRDKGTAEDLKTNMEQLAVLKDSENQRFKGYHLIPFSLQRITDAFQKSIIDGSSMDRFKDNKVVKEEIESMEKIFSEELEIYKERRFRGDQYQFGS